MFSAALRMLRIKDLKDLSVYREAGYYRHAGPKGPEEVPITVGRGPVPRRASIRTENGLGLRAFFARVERSRGTGPRATGHDGVLFAMHPFGIRRSRTTVSYPPDGPPQTKHCSLPRHYNPVKSCKSRKSCS